MQTLVIRYLPSGERSNTRKLLDAFLEAARGQAVETLDLTRDVPDLFVTENLAAYVQRHYLGQALDPAGLQQLAKMDRFTAQLKKADVAVLAFPMHNFGLPAVVKAYFDSVLLKGQTWDMGPAGYVGMMKGRKALILNTSGGVYEGARAGWEHAVSLAKVEFQFMGYDDIRAVTAGGMNSAPDQAPAAIRKAQDQVCAIAREWYG